MATDTPYRLTVVMPASPQVADAWYFPLANWLNAREAGTVPDDLGPELNSIGFGDATHRWCSSSGTVTGTYETLDHLAVLVSVTMPTQPTWDAWTMAEQCEWANETLHPELESVARGGVLLEDATAETDSFQLLATMGLQRILPLLPGHLDKNLVWRVRADLGVSQYPEDVFTPGVPVENGDPVGWWEDLGPFKKSLLQDDPDLYPTWNSDRINGHPAVSGAATEPGYPNEPTLLSQSLAHNIGAGPFSFFAVVRFASFDFEYGNLYETIWCSYLTQSRMVTIGAKRGDVEVGESPDWNVRIEISYEELPVISDVGLSFHAHALQLDTWYYLLLTRRESDSMMRLWVNGAHVPEAEELEENQIVTKPIPNGNQYLFISNEHEYPYPFLGEIAEVGLFSECVETSGQKLDLDAYIWNRYGI